MKRKIIPVILLFVAASMALAACMNDGANEVQTTPEPTANYAPNAADGSVNGSRGDNGAAQNGNSAAQNNNGAAQNGNGAAGLTGDANTGAAGNTAATTDGALNPFDWTNGASNVEQAIAQISELSDARVVVVNSTALVGVKFDNAYKGELTERIREMVAAEVLKVDPAIQTVAVTATAEDVDKVYDLSEQIRSGRTADELSAEINSIVRNATTLR